MKLLIFLAVACLSCAAKHRCVLDQDLIQNIIATEEKEMTEIRLKEFRMADVSFERFAIKTPKGDISVFYEGVPSGVRIIARTGEETKLKKVFTGLDRQTICRERDGKTYLFIEEGQEGFTKAFDKLPRGERFKVKSAYEGSLQ